MSQGVVYYRCPSDNTKEYAKSERPFQEAVESSENGCCGYLFDTKVLYILKEKYNEDAF
jgi:hypothetical protein